MIQIPAFRFTRAELDSLARRYRDEFEAAQPFRHVVIPDFLPEEIARALAAEFPGPRDIPWRIAGPGDTAHTHDPDIEKICTPNEDRFPPLIRHVMHEFNCGVFVQFLTELTGFQLLAPDPSFHGCGLHSTGRGGRLMIHADASRHPNPKFHQILNVIYYVTPGWREEWGGKLELWDSELTSCVKEVVPAFNSLMVFFTGATSYHGHPHPLQTPPGVRRNSLAAYYYTTDRENDETYTGYKNYAEWIRTTDLDRQVNLYHRTKEAVRRHLPRTFVNTLAQALRQVRRQTVGNRLLVVPDARKHDSAPSVRPAPPDQSV